MPEKVVLCMGKRGLGHIAAVNSRRIGLDKCRAASSHRGEKSRGGVNSASYCSVIFLDGPIRTGFMTIHMQVSILIWKHPLIVAAERQPPMPRKSITTELFQLSKQKIKHKETVDRSGNRT